MKRKNTSVLLLILLGFISSAKADLTWSQGEITLDIEEVRVVQIYSDNPALHFYNVTMGADWQPGDAAEIADVTPLFLAGDLAYADTLASPGWWYLEAGWSGVGPISVWGDHWDVSIRGLAAGSYALNTDIYGGAGSTNDILSITVIPEPMTIAFLAVGTIFLRKRR